MRGSFLTLQLALLVACRANFDELQPETPDLRGPNTPELVADSALAVWYELDDITGRLALDTSGNEHHGACRAACPTVVDGYVDRAAAFSGTVFLDVPPLALVDEFTITGFVKLPPNSGLACVAIDRAAGAAWNVCAASSGVTFRTGSHTLTIGMPIPTGTWVAMAARWDGVTKALFVGGRLAGTAEAAGTLPPQLVTIGGFNGQLDDVRIFDRAVTDDYIIGLQREVE